MLDKLNFDKVRGATKQLVQAPIARQILFFDEMLTPRLLQIVYWAALVAVIWQGVGRIFSGSFYGFIEGVVFITLGCLVARVASELVMLLFQMHKNMEKVANNTVIKPAQGNKAVYEPTNEVPGNTKSSSTSAKKQSKKAAKKVTKKITKKVTRKNN
jgi:hypothetical protein